MRSLTRLSPFAALLAAGCLYGFSGGGGLPSHIETVYVPPVENETARFELTERFTQGLLTAVRDRLGAQLASETAADAVVRASLTGYRDQAMNVQRQEGVGARVFQRRITLTASVEIVDRSRGQAIWSSTAVSGTGEYAPDEESEDVGMEQALENLVQKIVDGAQTQW